MGHARSAEADVAQLAAAAVEKGVVPVVDVSSVVSCIWRCPPQARLGKGLLDSAWGAQCTVTHVVAAHTLDVVLVPNVVVVSTRSPAEQIVAAVCTISTALADSRAAWKAKPCRQTIGGQVDRLAVLRGAGGPFRDLPPWSVLVDWL